MFPGTLRYDLSISAMCGIGGENVVGRLSLTKYYKYRYFSIVFKLYSLNTLGFCRKYAQHSYLIDKIGGATHDGTIRGKLSLNHYCPSLTLVSRLVVEIWQNIVHLTLPLFPNNVYETQDKKSSNDEIHRLR